MIKEKQNIKGCVDFCIEDRSKNKIFYTINNAILRSGKSALASSLANEFGGPVYPFYISRMIFGDGGTIGGNTRTVGEERTSLFGTELASKQVISSIDPSITTQVIFTSILSFDEANGKTINEMALKMSNDSLYSMVTFPDLTKTNQIQITWNWRINFI